MTEELGSVAPLATPSVASPSLEWEPATPSSAGWFRKRPVVIDAFRLGQSWPDWWAHLHSRNEVTTHNVDGRHRGGPDYALIHTREGVMRAEKGDWIIRGVKGEVYPCKPDVFAATYEPAELENAPGIGQGETVLILDSERSIEGVATTSTSVGEVRAEGDTRPNQNNTSHTLKGAEG